MADRYGHNFITTGRRPSNVQNAGKTTTKTPQTTPLLMTPAALPPLSPYPPPTGYRCTITCATGFEMPTVEGDVVYATCNTTRQGWDLSVESYTCVRTWPSFASRRDVLPLLSLSSDARCAPRRHNARTHTLHHLVCPLQRWTADRCPSPRAVSRPTTAARPRPARHAPWSASRATSSWARRSTSERPLDRHGRQVRRCARTASSP